jgi:hypothetical protein
MRGRSTASGKHAIVCCLATGCYAHYNSTPFATQQDARAQHHYGGAYSGSRHAAHLVAVWSEAGRGCYQEEALLRPEAHESAAPEILEGTRGESSAPHGVYVLICAAAPRLRNWLSCAS